MPSPIENENIGIVCAPSVNVGGWFHGPNSKSKIAGISTLQTIYAQIRYIPPQCFFFSLPDISRQVKIPLPITVSNVPVFIFTVIFISLKATRFFI